MEKNDRIQVMESLTEDEALVNDFIQTRLKKVLADIKELADTKSDDEMAWSASFTYLSRTYGRNSDETFKWYKYYLREQMLPEGIALPLLIQIYMDATVDKGFVNILSRVMKAEAAETKQARLEEMKKEMAEYMDEDGKITLYRGCFDKPFGTEEDASRTIDKGFTFSLDKDVAKHYAKCWFPKTAKVYTVKADPADIAWYSLYDEEKTVIALPQSKGSAIQVVAEEIVPGSEYGTMDEMRNARQAYIMSFKK